MFLSQKQQHSFQLYYLHLHWLVLWNALAQWGLLVFHLLFLKIFLAIGGGTTFSSDQNVGDVASGSSIKGIMLNRNKSVVQAVAGREEV